MAYSSELEMYPPVMNWLRHHLAGKLRQATIEVFDTHSSPLNQFLARNGLHRFFESDLWQTFDIRVDVTAFVKLASAKGLVFVECKTQPIGLAHLSQLLGYTRIAVPLGAYLISPRGVSGIVRSLILTHGRTDVLEYARPKGKAPRGLVLARWEPRVNDLDRTSILPPGAV